MKFTCTQENLNRGLLKVQGVTNQATSLPILKNIYLEAKNGVLKLKATDLEIGMVTQVRGKSETEGQLTVDAKLINNFVALLPQDKVLLSTEGKHLLVKCGSHKTKILGLSSDDFPVIPEVVRQRGFKIKVDKFKKSLSQVLTAVSPDDTRPEINGVYFKIDDQTLTLVGTDSYRLAEKKIDLLANLKFQGSFIVPLKTVKEFVRTVDDADKTVEIFVTDNQILFVYGLTEMVSRLVEGEFPDYQQIIPTSHKYQLTLAKDDLVKAVKISGLFAASDSNSVIFELKPTKSVLAISSSTSLGEEYSELNVKIDGAGDLKIVFDYRYLLDGLNSLEGADVVFWASSEASPSALKSPEEKEAWLYIVMPIRQ